MKPVIRYAILALAALVFVCGSATARDGQKVRGGEGSRQGNDRVYSGNGHHRSHDSRVYSNQSSHQSSHRPAQSRPNERHASQRYRYDGRHDSHAGPYRQGANYRSSSPGYGSPRWESKGPRYHWSRGERLHAHYRGPVYAVNDYHYYGLRRPPQDYRWMRDGYGDFLLVAVATGIVIDLVLRH
ncbi:MAG: RcnB family protein [Xanthomonadaceae bacterium]|jgi:Ni/Co efflux regulator RcnB|nr:RcnB family protein [Xanthomonadaceae bacterium]